MSGYWKDSEGICGELVAFALEKLRSLKTLPPDFRLVVHYGLVGIGGGAGLGEEPLILALTQSPLSDRALIWMPMSLPTLIGIQNSIGAVVVDREILQKEIKAGLYPGAYLPVKFISIEMSNLVQVLTISGLIDLTGLFQGELLPKILP
jgi:hypothetical protein